MAGMNYEELKNLYDNITKITDDMLDQVKQAKDIVGKMNNNEHWKGDGYDSYNKKFKALASNFGAFVNEIYKVNNNIRSSIERNKEVDKQVSSSLSVEY